eukprot:m.297365 g.297365  ORF g.297365 m.297365 type:complete len:201 (+) comp13598_c0_seq1:224-826(+)
MAWFTDLPIVASAAGGLVLLVVLAIAAYCYRASRSEQPVVDAEAGLASNDSLFKERTTANPLFGRSSSILSEASAPGAIEEGTTCEAKNLIPNHAASPQQQQPPTPAAPPSTPAPPTTDSPAPSTDSPAPAPQADASASPPAAAGTAPRPSVASSTSSDAGGDRANRLAAMREARRKKKESEWQALVEALAVIDALSETD